VPVATPLAHRLELAVHGVPAPQGSKRILNGHLVESSRQLTTWREDVKLAALRAREDTPSWERDYPAILVSLHFVLARPKSHYLHRVGGSVLRENAPQLHTHMPDLDKLVRSTLDALTAAGIYADDARVAELFAQKLYGDDPGVRISLTGCRL
jgi:Holliday junction resolvase RusA-like endonuclease